MLRYEIVYTAASISMLNAGVAFRLERINETHMQLLR